MTVHLVERWHALPEDRRQHILNHAAVYTFTVTAVSGILFVSAVARLGTLAGAALVMALLGLAGAFVAGRRGRSRALWGLACFLLPIVGLVVVLVFPDEMWHGK